MPASACTIRWVGKRVVSWRIQYIDASGKVVKETLGREPPWNEQLAERELGKRLAEVAEQGYRKPDKLTFAQYTERFREEYLPGRNLKPSTLDGYRHMLDGHLLPHFGRRKLHQLEQQPELIDAYIATKTKTGLGPKSIHNQLLLLNLMFKRAIVWRLIRSNPLEAIDRPRYIPPEMNILNEAEIAALNNAYHQLAAESQPDREIWWLLAHTMVVVALGTGLRRSELFALHWNTINFLENRLTVREAIVRGQKTTPKSRASRRVIELGPHTQHALEQHWQRTTYRGEEDLVFAHPHLGGPLDPSSLARNYLKPALHKAGITKPFRPFHDLRHTSLTHTAAAGNPAIYVQHRAGHSSAAITERYLHASQIQFPGAAQRSEQRIFGNTLTEETS